MAMIRTVGIGLLSVVSLASFANGNAGLGLTAADLERLGVTLSAAVPISEIEVASGPAELVIPPARQAVVSATVGGVLSRTFVAEGDTVVPGQGLAEIASADLLDAQRAFFDAAMSAELAGAQLERDAGLYADGIIAERRLQESTAAERSASAALEQHRQRLTLAGMTEPDLARLLDNGTLSSALTLTAPFEAVVIEQLSSLGTRVDALDPVYRVADLGELWLEVHVPQESAQRIAAGMRVVGATAGGSVEGIVTHVGRVVDAATQTVMIRAHVPNDALRLRAGQFLSARVIAGDPGSTAHVVPSAAVVRVDDRPYVFASRSGAIVPLEVELLSNNGVDTYVRGLEADLEIAITGTAALKSVWLADTAEGQ
jgi:cobalt-zinc-cadmium efflux system membrane fusion protein